MSSHDGLGRELADLSQVLLSEETMETLLKRVTQASTELIPACDACSVSVVGDGKVRTRAASDPVSQHVDNQQYESEQGPCLEAIDTERAIRSRCMTEETRWPRFSQAAVAEGVAGSYSLPLRVGGRTMGALNLYSMRQPFEEEDERLAATFADQAAVLVANASAYHQAQELAHHLEEALKSRDVIGQAKGIIMERERVTADGAFDVLRKMSQVRNMKLRDVAELVTTTGTWEKATSGDGAAAADGGNGQRTRTTRRTSVAGSGSSG